MTTQTLTLTEFLLARIAEDEMLAHRAGLHLRVIYPQDSTPGLAVAGTRVWSVDRALAECAAKRRILERAARDMDESRYDYNIASAMDAEYNVQDLAIVYADHEDYREEWKP